MDKNGTDFILIGLISLIDLDADLLHGLVSQFTFCFAMKTCAIEIQMLNNHRYSCPVVIIC